MRRTCELWLCLESLKTRIQSRKEVRQGTENQSAPQSKPESKKFERQCPLLDGFRDRQSWHWRPHQVRASSLDSLVAAQHSQPTIARRGDVAGCVARVMRALGVNKRGPQIRVRRASVLGNTHSPIKLAASPFSLITARPAQSHNQGAGRTRGERSTGFGGISPMARGRQIE